MQPKGLTGLFPPIFRQAITQLQEGDNWTETFIRVGMPVSFFVGGGEYTLSSEGELMNFNNSTIKKAYIASQQDLQEILHHATKATPLVYEEEIAQGYLTLEGGHRLGFAGELVNGNLGGVEKTHFKYITGMMLRIAREKKGCADKVLPFLLGRENIYNSLIISPPGCGKTTLLRDCVRQLSGGSNGKKVVVVDERMEVAAAYRGSPQFDVGIRTNVLSGCKKEMGFVMAVRSLSPEILAADEIGFQEESKALLYGIYSGCGVICTTHGSNIEDVKSRNGLSPLFDEGIFKRYVILERYGREFGAKVLNDEGEILYE